MKKYILSSMVLTGILTNVFAQDPQLSSPSLYPIPAVVNGQVTLAFAFQNASSTPIENPDPHNPMSIMISLNKIRPTLDIIGNPVVTGLGAAYFDWIAYCNGTCATDGSSDATDVWKLTGVQNSVVPGQTDPFQIVGGPILLTGKVTAAFTPEQAKDFNGNGFTVNLSPGSGGDIDLSVASNMRAEFGFTVDPTKVFDKPKDTNHGTDDTFALLVNDIDGRAAIDLITTDQQPNTNLPDWINQTHDILIPEFHILVYPNPVEDKLMIKSAVPKRIQLLNLQGAVIYETSGIPAGGIDMSALPSGVYLVKISQKDGTSTIRKVVRE